MAAKPLDHARPRAGRRNLRRNRGAHRILAILAIAALTPWPAWLFMSTPEARAADATAASFSGVTDSYTNPATGQIYVKQGGSVKLNVTTTSDTKCVDVNFNTSSQKLTQTSSTAKTSWSFTINVGAGDGAVTATASASPNFNANGVCTGSTPGNAKVSASYILDNTGPVVTGVKTPAANAAGWNNSNVAIAWTATDVGSGVKTGPTPSTDSVISNTAGVTKTSTATDNLGNVGTGSVAVKLDKTLPSIDATRSPAPNSLGWNNTDVTVGFTCSDALSGIKSCSGGGSVTVSTEGANQSVQGEAVDNADNRNAAGVTGINIDKTRPTLTGTPVGAPTGTDAQGVKWYSGDVAIAWNAADALSGLAGAAPANSTITGEGKELFATQSVSDKAGNTTSADSAKVNIDRKAPSTDATAPSGWTNTGQTVTLSAKDALSGVKATHYVLDGGSRQTGTSVAVQGDGVHTLEYWSEDFAGNVEAHKTIAVKVDGTSPTISHTQFPLANANGWNNTDVKVSFLCEDALSGIASCTPDKVVSDEGKDQLVTGTATDNAGNTATDPATVSIDKTAPKVAAAADRDANGNLAANGKGWYADDVTVGFSCSDALSGIDSCPVAKTLGEGYGQSASGTGTDAAGNGAVGSLTGINIDSTAPSLSGEPTTSANGAGWYRGDVTIAWSCADALSGIDGGCPADSTLTGEGGDLRAGASVSDRAGHVTSASSASVRIDRTAPSTSATVPSALASGWYAGPVTVTLNAVDSLSGVGKTLYTVDGDAAQVYDGAAKPSIGKGTHTVSFWSVDNAGNVEDRTAAGNSITLKVDDVKPTITGSRLPAANAFGWNNSPVDVTFACTDAESGIAGCTGDTTVSGEGNDQSVVGHAVDNAGNAAGATVDGINIDRTKPTLEGRPTTPDNAAGWYKGDVTIAWQGQDGLSGIDPASLPANSVITGQGAGLKAGPATVRDKAGNVSDPTSSQAVNIDRTPPTITGSRSPAANLLGWNNGPVTVGFSCSDALSGVAECPAPVVVDADGTGLSASGTATDQADNTAAATVGNIKIDSKAPRSDGNLVCTSKNGYCKGTSASVNITATDPAPAAGITTSGPKEIKFRVNGGLVSTAPGSTATANVTLSGSGTAIVEFWAVDNAGNAETPNKLEIKYDTIAPAITHSQPGNAAGWSNGDATVRFRAEDDSDGSGLDRAATFCGPTPAAAEGAVTADPYNAKVLFCETTRTAETAGQVIKAQVDDIAGNTGFDSHTVKVDRTKPTIGATATGAQGRNGWYKGPVTVTFTCSDPLGANGATGSGIATCPSAEVIGNGAGQTVAGTAEDRADNRASTTAGPFNVDTDGPKVEVGGVANGGVYTLGSVPKATCTATDVGPSGLDGTCSVSVTGGLANGVGTFSFSATAKDVAGNVTTVTGSYRVIYNVPQGTAFWLQPINDTAHEVNATTSVFKAGSTVPAKFRLRDANGQAIQTNTAPVWLSPVKGSATTAVVDETVYTEPADTTTTFRWSVTDQQYHYNWASPKNGAGYYWRIGVRLDDGTMQTVNIALR